VVLNYLLMVAPLLDVVATEAQVGLMAATMEIALMVMKMVARLAVYNTQKNFYPPLVVT
jgi:hypothetical protein